MAEKKPSFFGRLFGKKEAEKPEAQTEETTEKVEAQPIDAAVAPDGATPTPPAQLDAAVAPNGATPAPPPDSNTVDATPVDQAISESEASDGAHAAQAGPDTDASSAASSQDEAKPEESVEPPSQAAPASPAPPPESDAGNSLPAEAPSPEKKKNWFQRLTSGLKKSSDQLTENIASVFTKRKLDDETLEQLEDVLIQADLGVDTAVEITEKLAQDRFNKEISVDEIREVLRDEVIKVLEPVAAPLVLDGSNTPHVILMVGVNGSGKTTTIGKLASKLTGEGKKVLLAAGDTFRAAAVEQLQGLGSALQC